MSWKTALLTLALAVVAIPARAGNIHGTIRFTGTVPPPKPQKILKDTTKCGKEAPDESLLVGAQGGLANAVISLENPPAEAESSDPPPTCRLEQQGCRFSPHVIAAQAGAKLQIQNLDPILHNVHARAGRKTAFNLAFPIRNQTLTVTLGEPGLLKTECDAGHTWMRSWIRVFPHRFFAVSAADGSFDIHDIPPGSYNLVVWHERLGTQTLPVQVSEADTIVKASFPLDQEDGDEEKARVVDSDRSDDGGL